MARDKPLYIASAICAIAVIYVAIAIAPYSQDGLFGILENIDYISFHPKDLIWADYTPKTILVCLFIYGFALLMLFSSKRRYHRRGKENGSADYASIKSLRKLFNSKSEQRIVFTKKFAMSVTEEDTYKHNRNYNTVVVGGPGSNKTLGYVIPNIFEAASNYVVLDPKGEVCRKTAKVMKKKGYNVKVLNLINPNYSWGYNPFAYIHQDTETEQRADDDIQRIVTAIFKATTAKNAQTIDPFWDEAGKMLLSALMYLVYYFGAEDEKNFPYLMNLIRAGVFEEDDEATYSPLDILFESIERVYPDHICVKYYRSATKGAGKTMKSIQITLLSRLQKFDIPSIAEMMANDELELEKLTTEPTIIYCIIPDNDSSYNFIVSMLYIQLFQVLYDKADNVYHGRMPRMVHVIMDEFYNVHVPEDFLHILGGCRSRNIGISIILQNLSQLKDLYKEAHENIIGLCDFFMYLGGNELSTHKYVSEMLGKETIDTTSSGRRYGMHGDSSANFQFAGRELLTPDEVRMLPYKYAILIIKNERPLIDKKINIFKYKKAKNTAFRGKNKKEMEYIIPLRSERLKVNQPVPVLDETEQETNIYNASVVGTSTQKASVEVHINGRTYDIYESDVSEFIETYYVLPMEMEEYLQKI